MPWPAAQADARPDGHYFAAADSRVGLWFGDIDDLWKLGKPVGRGGPWLDTAVESGQPSDPYLMAGYDRKSLALSHDAAQAVHFTVEVDVVADGNWLSYATIEVPPRRTITHVFPAGYAAHSGPPQSQPRLQGDGTVQLRVICNEL